jgi:hypothetical protein
MQAILLALGRSSIIIGITAVVVLVNTNIDASYAGLAMTFIMGLTGDILFLVRRFVSLEQSMVAVSFPLVAIKLA